MEQAAALTAKLGECKQCGGDGLCTRCHGRGQHMETASRVVGPCKGCQAQGTCSTCRGYGVQLPRCGVCAAQPGRCEFCQGARRIAQPGGVGSTSCPLCRGTGNCRRCGGTTTIDDAPGLVMRALPVADPQAATGPY